MIKGLDLLIGSASKSNFWQYVNCIIKGNLIDFEIEKNDFLIKGLNFLIGSASKSNFWQYFNCGIKGNSKDFEIEKIVSIQVLNLLTRSASKSNFWQCFHCVIKGNLIDFELEKQNVKVLNSLLGFPKHKSPPNNKNYLRCLLCGGAFSMRGKGLYIYTCIYFYEPQQKKIHFFGDTAVMGQG